MGKTVPCLWPDSTIVCMATGPSLTQADCDYVRELGVPTIAINDAHRLAPWANVLYSNDRMWWRKYKGVPSFTGVTQNVPLLAFQDGDGAWTSLTGTAGVYHATVTGQRYGLAVGCGQPDTSLALYYQAVSDATDLGIDGCFPAPSDTADIAVSVLNADGKQTSISVGVVGDSITGTGLLHLAVPQNHHERRFLHLCVANLCANLFTLKIRLHPQTRAAQLRRHLLGVVINPIGDRQHSHLHRRQPHRKSTRIMLD